ncbi:hypothetical protein HYQ46_001809 [Verticillium longisporum]|nr:hypothetical protein HYQ46_001809 [Verticillium longisporum]
MLAIKVRVVEPQNPVWAAEEWVDRRDGDIRDLATGRANGINGLLKTSDLVLPLGGRRQLVSDDAGKHTHSFQLSGQVCRPLFVLSQL